MKGTLSQVTQITSKQFPIAEISAHTASGKNIHRALQLKNPSPEGVIGPFFITFGPIALAYSSPEYYLDRYIEFSPIRFLVARELNLCVCDCVRDRLIEP